MIAHDASQSLKVIRYQAKTLGRSRVHTFQASAGTKNTRG